MDCPFLVLIKPTQRSVLTVAALKLRNIAIEREPKHIQMWRLLNVLVSASGKNRPPVWKANSIRLVAETPHRQDLRGIISSSSAQINHSLAFLGNVFRRAVSSILFAVSFCVVSG